MKMHVPISNPLYGPVLIRLPLGAYFVLAGMLKLENPTAFAKEVQHYGILKEPLATLYGILLPYVEIVAGGMMVVGMWTTLAAILTSLMLLSYIIALRLFPEAQSRLFNKDVILLGASLSLLFTGGGFFSVDHFRKTG